MRELLKRVPQSIKTYYEPFVGGGALFYELANAQRFKSAKVNDLNPHLMMAYEVVRDEPQVLIKALKKLPNEEEFYLKFRKKQAFKSAVDRAAWFLYLNKTAFNGLWRVNSRGEFNVPFGHYKNPSICDADTIRACSQALRGVEITVSDFEIVVAKAKKGDFIYFDPPYAPRTSNFVGYTKEGFGEKDQIRLAEVARKLKKRGVDVLLSNSDVELIRELYSDFTIEEVSGRRSVGATEERRGNVGDVLIS